MSTRPSPSLPILNIPRLLEERLNNRRQIRDVVVTILPTPEVPQIARSLCALLIHALKAIGNAKGRRPSSIILAGPPLRPKPDQRYHPTTRITIHMICEHPAYLPRGREATLKVRLIML